jgi:uncharacterized membrane protein YwzB
VVVVLAAVVVVVVVLVVVVVVVKWALQEKFRIDKVAIGSTGKVVVVVRCYE